MRLSYYYIRIEIKVKGPVRKKVYMHVNEFNEFYSHMNIKI